MKRVGLITIHDIINCGSSLQTYATLKIVNLLGYDCTVIDYKYPSKRHRKALSRTSNAPFLFRTLRYIYHAYIVPRFKSSLQFKRFKNKYLKLTRKYCTLEDITSNPPIFDIYLVGSDQVWNPYYMHDDTAWLLSFVSGDKLKISYASSFGTSEMLPQYIEAYKKYLSKFNVISVREKSGINTVNKFTGKSAKHVLDPTLLLNSGQWNEIATLKPSNDKPYILCYMLLYSVNPFPYVYDLIEFLKENYDYDVIFITGGDKKEIIRRGYQYKGVVAPNDFLAYFRDASFVVTSSFHGTAFSINYAKPFFTIVDPNSKDDRMESLIEMVGAKSREIPIGGKLPSKEGLKMDFSEISKKLEGERIKSINYLKYALNGQIF